MKFRKFLRGWIGILLQILALASLIYFQVWLPEQKNESLPYQLIPASTFYLTALIVISLGETIIVGLYRRKKKLIGTTDNFILGIEQITDIIRVITLFFAISLLFSIDLKQLFTSLSIIAAAIAIISKDYISNMVNGMILTFSNQISVNDYVKIGNHKGIIVDINLINVNLVNDEDDMIFLPNNVVFMSDIVNYTKRIVNRVNHEFEMKYEFLEEVSNLENYIISKLSDYEPFIIPETMALRTLEIKQEAALFNFQYLLKEPNREVEKQIRKAVSRAIIRFIAARKAKKEIIDG